MSQTPANPGHPPASHTAILMDEPAPSIGGKGALGLLLTVGLIAVGWAPTFQAMWLRWFPKWTSPLKLSLSDRLFEGESYYTHAPMVAFASLVMAWFIYKRIGVPARRDLAGTITGWIVLTGSVLLHLMSVYARVNFVSGFALIGVLLGLLLIWGGWPLLRAYGLPVIFLVFMVPLPEAWIADLNFKLKMLAGGGAVWITRNLFGIPIVSDGSYVELMPDPVTGLPKVLIVENVCSGLRSLISLVWFASLFAVICRVKGLWRLVMLAMAVPVAVLCNVIRITGLNVVAHHFSVDAASEGRPFHDWSGVGVFVVALALLFGLEAVILRLGKLFKRQWSDVKLMGFLERIAATGMSPGVWRPGVLGLLVVSAGLSLFWSRQSVAENVGGYAAKAVPAEATIREVHYAGTDYELDDNTLTILETRDYLYRRYTAGRGERVVSLVIVFSQDNRKGTHPPDMCLEGGGDHIIAKGPVPMDLPGMGPLTMREIVTQRNVSKAYHLYVYKCGDSYTPDFFTQQFKIFLNGVTSRNAAGALIRFTVDAPEGTEEDLQQARETALAAATALMPEIDKGLP